MLKIMPVHYLVLALIIPLSACGSLIPPQTIPDPISVSGKRVAVEIGATELTTTAAGLGLINSNFPDIDLDALPINVNLSQSLFKVGFAAETQLNTLSTALPCSIILTKVDIKVTLKDDVQTFVLPTFKVNKVVTLEQQKADPSSYKIATDDVFVGIALKEDEVKQLQSIITSGGDNAVEIKVIVSATSVPDLPPGSILTFTFDTSEATFAF